MIPTATLRSIAQGRLDDAAHLVDGRRFDGAAYLCGYAVELALKARICDTLGWAGFPETSKDFRRFQSLKTHNLETLLSFTAQERNVKTNFLLEWLAVMEWDPESRYSAPGTVTEGKARRMVDAATTLLGVL